MNSKFVERLKKEQIELLREYIGLIQYMITQHGDKLSKEDIAVLEQKSTDALDKYVIQKTFIDQ